LTATNNFISPLMVPKYTSQILNKNSIYSLILIMEVTRDGRWQKSYGLDLMQ
jgi:hypothetical protein